jgi:hypothetical protein
LLLIDGEAVVLGVDGISDFEALGSRKHDAEVQLYAFYVLALDSEDLRRLPLSMRKTNLDRLSARRPEEIFVAPFERGKIGPDLFRAACKMGLEGLVSKRQDRAYRGGRCDALDQGQEPGVAGDESRGGNRLVAVTERSTIASETVALTFDTSETAVTALRAV